jgi:hypothetical protein
MGLDCVGLHSFVIIELLQNYLGFVKGNTDFEQYMFEKEILILIIN